MKASIVADLLETSGYFLLILVLSLSFISLSILALMIATGIDLFQLGLDSGLASASMYVCACIMLFIKACLRGFVKSVSEGGSM